MSLRDKALRGMFWSVVDKLVNQLGLLLVTIYLARVLGPFSFGLIGMLSVFLLIAQSLVDSGFSQALIQRSNKVTDRDTSTVFYVNVAIACLLYIILYISSPAISAFYHEPALTGVGRVLFLVLIINALAVVIRAKLTIIIDFRSQAVAGVTSTIIGAIVAITMAKNGYGYWALVALILIRATVQNIVLWMYCQWLPSLVFSTVSFKRLFGFGSKLLVTGVVATTTNNLYALLIGRYFGPTDVGYFTQAQSLTNNVSTLITSVFQSVTYPVMTSVNDDLPRMVAIYKRLVQITMATALPFLIGFAAVAEEFTKIFLGEEWLAIVPVLIILSFARMITPISVVNMNLLNAIGRSDLFMKIDLSKLPLSLGALWLSIPYGINGVAWAMLCTSAISFFINAYFPGKLYNFGARAQLKAAFKPFLAAALMYATVSVVAIENLYYTLIMKVFIGAVIYSAALYIMRVPIIDEIKMHLNRNRK